MPHRKTIRVPVNFGAVADLVDATLTPLGTPTIHIAENSVGTPVTFTSVLLYISHQDVSTVTGATITEFRASVQLGAAGALTVTELDDLSNTGENISGIIGPLDVTSHFTGANFGTGTSQTCAVQAYFDVSTGTGLNMRAVYAELVITYEYADSPTNFSDYIAIPLNDTNAALSTTANTVLATIPALTGVSRLFEGVASLNIRHAWVELRGSDGINNTTTSDPGLVVAFNGGASISLPLTETALATDLYHQYFIDASALDFSTTNTLEVWSTVATRWQNLAAILHLQFDYTVAGTTHRPYMIQVPVEYESPIPGTANTDRHRFQRSVLIAESTPTFFYGGVMIHYNNNAGATPQIRAGSQASFRAYASVATMLGGQFTFQHLLDSRSAAGGAIASLSRGENTVTIDLYRSAGAMWNVSGLLTLIYRAVPPTDHGNGTRTHISLVRQIDFTATGDNTVTDALAIAESNYWLIGAGLRFNYYLSSAANAFMVAVEVNAGEADGDGWRALYQDALVGESGPELTFGEWYVRARPEFRRYPQDPDTNRLDIETSRRLRVTSTTTFRFGYVWFASYHTQAFTATRDVSGATGGETVDIKVFRADTDELVFETSRVGDGTYTVTYYNPSVELYSVAVGLTSGKTARSANFQVS